MFLEKRRWLTLSTTLSQYLVNKGFSWINVLCNIKISLHLASAITGAYGSVLHLDWEYSIFGLREALKKEIGYF